MLASSRRGFMGGLAAMGLAPRTALAANADMAFPKGFIWGAATSAYQIEGAVDEGGRGASIWDTFATTPGKIRDGLSGARSADSYHRWPEDHRLLKEMGLASYRFSLAWPRIQPTGRGPANQQGLDLYRRQVDSLLELGIRPFVTLFHWDLPQTLGDAGGWTNRDTAERFADYTQIVAGALADRVENWCVLNEPQAFTGAGYAAGIHAPGEKSFERSMRASHVANLAYAKSRAVLKAARTDALVGNALDMSPGIPATDSKADRRAAEKHDDLNQLWFLQPILTGRYPEILPADRQAALLGIEPGDETVLRCGYDFVGLNYYTPSLVTANPQAPTGISSTFGRGRGNLPRTDIGWDVWPEGLYRLLMRIRAVAPGLPIEITEQGCADNTAPGPDGRIVDYRRQDYLRAHVAEVRRAIRDGAPVRSYHAWTLIDNFEWQEGYTQRFGLVWVDYESFRRIPKESARWYAEAARTNGASVL